MRPPEHWHIRQRRRQPTVFSLVAACSVVFLAVITWQLWPTSGARPAETVDSGSSVVECAGGGLCVSTGIAYAGAVAPPAVRGASAVVAEEPCGAELYAKYPDARRPPASLTKLATALVAVDRASLDEQVLIDVNSALLVASSGSTVMGLEPGETLSMRDLLYGLLLPSGNDAAIAIAEDVGGTIPSFVDLMNLKARELGLENTHFANPHGLDEPGLYTSARDMVVLGRAVLADPELASMVRAQHYQPSWDGPEVWNSNELVGLYQGEVIGVKIGYTEGAGQTIVAAVERDGRRLLVSVLGSWDRYADVISLFEWAFANTQPAC